MRALAYSQTDVVFIAFSIMDRDSYANVRTVWNKEKEKFMTAARVGISILDLISPPCCTGDSHRDEEGFSRR